MPFLETSGSWAFTSTGSGKAVKAWTAQSLTWNLETSSGCTATVQILTRQGSSSGVYSCVSTLNCTLADNVTAQFIGPMKWVKPRVTDKTAGSTASIAIKMVGV